ncbi:Acetylcholinesterase [Manis pentadactyla]|nr:Acetylcholinesterase [Manis pentadactyla]
MHPKNESSSGLPSDVYKLLKKKHGDEVVRDSYHDPFKRQQHEPGRGLHVETRPGLFREGHPPWTTGRKETAELWAEPLPDPRKQPSLPPEGGEPSKKTKGSSGERRPRVRVRQCARVRVEVRAAARGLQGLKTGKEKRREEQARRRGTAERRGARARPLVAGGEDARGGLAALPAPGEIRAPAARACAARRLGSALSPQCARSQSPPPTSSRTSRSAAAAATAAAHLLPPPSQPLSPLLSSPVLALCRLSGGP